MSETQSFAYDDYKDLGHYIELLLPRVDVAVAVLDQPLYAIIVDTPFEKQCPD